jgi:hypothetical protein
VDTNSGGTVTSLATGAGLTGGPVTTSGTMSVATDGITASMIAPGAVGLSQIDTSQPGEPRRQVLDPPPLLLQLEKESALAGDR